MMEESDYTGIFSENVKRMMEAEFPPLTQATLAVRAKMHQRTLGRIINREVTPTLDMMGNIARGLDVALWQMLVPRIDPRNLPALAPVSERERALWNTIRQAAQDLGTDREIR